MKLKILALFAALLALVGCENKDASVNVGPFHVNSDTGVATGNAFGIEFEAEGATKVEVKSGISGSSESSSRAAITLANDLKITLETVDGGSSVSFLLNGKDFGRLEKGDEVKIEKDRTVVINGEKKNGRESP